MVSQFYFVQIVTQLRFVCPKNDNDIIKMFHNVQLIGCKIGARSQSLIDNKVLSIHKYFNQSKVYMLMLIHIFNVFKALAYPTFI